MLRRHRGAERCYVLAVIRFPGYRGGRNCGRCNVKGTAQLDITKNMSPCHCPPKKETFFAPAWRQAGLGELLLGRVDHALFVSMWACLFSDVKKSRKDDDGAKRLIELLSGPRSVQALRSTRSRLALKFLARCHRGAQLRHLPRCHRGAQLRHLPRRHRGAHMFS